MIPLDKKIVLAVVINRDSAETGFLGVNEYQGIGYIKTFLEKHNYSVQILVIFSNQSSDILSLFPEEPLLVGFSMYSDNVDSTLLIAKELKQHYTKTHITLGGPQVNSFERNILKENNWIDSITMLEGEETTLELANNLKAGIELNQCKGIVYRNKKNEIVYNEVRQPVQNLDALPFPSRDIHKKYKQQYLYITGSRGCLGGCSFCGETSVKRKHKPPYVRLRSAGSIVDEMELLINQFQINSFRLTDATFEDPGEDGVRRAYEIFEEIQRRQLKVSLHLFTRAELVEKLSDEYYLKAKEAGVECFYIGVESGNDIDLKLYCKRSRVTNNNVAIEKIRKSGIHVGIGFICFNPFSTYDSLKSNADFMYKSGLGHVFYLMQTRLEVFPQSQLCKVLKDNDLIDKDVDYRSHFYDYRFADPKISELFVVIKKAYTALPIYYMDTILGMGKVWAKRMLSGDRVNKILEMYAKLDLLCEKYNEKNYRFICTCLDMSANGASKEMLEKQIDVFNLNDIYPEYLSLYNQINIRVTKERLKYFMS